MPSILGTPSIGCQSPRKWELEDLRKVGSKGKLRQKKGLLSLFNLYMVRYNFFKSLVEPSVSSVFPIVFISLSRWMKWSLVAILEWMRTMNDQRQLSKNPNTLKKVPFCYNDSFSNKTPKRPKEWTTIVDFSISETLIVLLLRAIIPPVESLS